MGGSPCCSKEGLNRGAWTTQEDRVLTDYIKLHGEGRWRNLPKKAGLKRCGKSCRLRWLNYLRPDIKRGNISSDEEELIIRLHKLLGNRWSLIAGRLPGRTDNEIKNYWNTNLGKRVQDQQGFINGRKGITKSEQKKKAENEMSTAQPSKQSQSLLDSHVVRTKAVKCSKPIIDPLPARKVDNRQKAVLSPSSSDERGENHAMEFAPFFPISTDNSDASHDDFSIDFDAADCSFSELMNSEFSDLCSWNYSMRSSDLSPPNQPLMCPEELLKDWTAHSSATSLQ